MTRWEQARDAGDRTVVWIAPRAAHARNAAVHYAADARDWATPRLEHGVRRARRQARQTTRERVVPAVDAARMKLTEFGRDTVAPAVGPRAQHAMDTAKQRMQDDVVPRVNHAAAAAREAGEPKLNEARSRAEAAVLALRGEVTAAEMNKIVKKKRHKKRKNMLVLMTALAIGAAAGWMWWQRKASEPEWKADESLAMPPAGPDAYRSAPTTTTAVTDPGHAIEDEEAEADGQMHTAGSAKGKHRNRDKS